MLISILTGNLLANWRQVNFFYLQAETQVFNEEAAANFVHNVGGLVMQPRQEVRESFASKRKRMRTERSKTWRK
jgi:hypothetical protein